jgi:DNA anti-recombination protein RmuC
MTADEQRQLDRMEAKLDHFMEELICVKVAQASHIASNTEHDIIHLAEELNNMRREVVKLGAIIGGAVLVVNSIAATIIVKTIGG